MSEALEVSNGAGTSAFRLLVCGGRDFGHRPKWAVFGTCEYIEMERKAAAERALLERVLSASEPRPSVLIHGAARGADSLAADWAKRNGILDLPFLADWYPNGRTGGLDRSAGPRRNARMIAEGRPDRVIAFAGGNGTSDMCRQARAAGIEVVEVERA
jgi:hypothetical protein